MQDNINQMINKYANSQIDYGEVKQGAGQDDILSIKTANSADIEAGIEYEKFKEKLKDIIKSSKSYNDAKELIRKTFKPDKDINYIRVGQAHCTITMNPGLLSVIINSDKELISYCFNTVTKEKRQNNR